MVQDDQSGQVRDRKCNKADFNGNPNQAACNRIRIRDRGIEKPRRRSKIQVARNPDYQRHWQKFTKPGNVFFRVLQQHLSSNHQTGQEFPQNAEEPVERSIKADLQPRILSTHKVGIHANHIRHRSLGQQCKS